MRLLTERWTRYVTGAFDRLPAVAILWIATGALTAIFGLFALMVYVSGEDVRDAAWTASSNLTAAVSRDIEREFTLLDTSLQDLVEGAEQPETVGLPNSLRQLILFDRAASGYGRGALLLLDATGHVTAQAGVPNPNPVDLSAEDFFQAHVRSRDAGLFVSRPFVSLIDGESSIAISRRIDRNGVFAGVALATIKLTFFKDLFSRLDLGHDGAMSLIAADGTFLMRQPFARVELGRLPTAFNIKGRIADAKRGNFPAESTVDGVRRQYFYEQVGDLPLVLFVGRGLDEVYRTWWHRTAVMAFAVFLLGNTILLLVVVLQSALRRREAAEAELAVLASTDKLTGLANRRAFDEVLDQEWARANDARGTIAILLVDIDHFKALNDAIGHQAGDTVLSGVGACLRRLARPGALIARYGGEEFVVVLPQGTLAEAVAVAEDLRAHIARMAEPNPGSPTGWLTVSIGVAVETPSSLGRASDLLRAADLALYRAKRGGRNRTIVADGLAIAA